MLQDGHKSTSPYSYHSSPRDLSPYSERSRDVSPYESNNCSRDVSPFSYDATSYEQPSNTGNFLQVPKSEPTKIPNRRRRASSGNKSNYSESPSFSLKASNDFLKKIPTGPKNLRCKYIIYIWTCTYFYNLFLIILFL